MFRLLIVPAQVSIMIALRSGSVIVLPVIVTVPSIVLSLAPERSTNAIAFTSKSPAIEAVPVVSTLLLVKREIGDAETIDAVLRRIVDVHLVEHDVACARSARCRSSRSESCRLSCCWRNRHRR